jgi:CHAT domain-containing protein
MRDQVTGEHSKRSYLTARQRYYASYVDVAMELHAGRPSAGFARDAFETAERARARTLLETLGDAALDSRRGVDPALLGQARDLRRQINFWSYRLAALADRRDTAANAAAIRERLDAMLAGYRETLARIDGASPRDAAFFSPQPLKIGEIQRQVLDPDTMLLRIALGPERSHAWAVTRDLVAGVVLPGQAQIEPVARRVHDLVSRPRTTRGASALPDQYRVEAAALSEMLLAPVARHLTTKRVLIVCDGILQLVPFAALPVPGTPNLLIDRHEVVMLPSASLLAALRRETARRPRAPLALAVIADPVYEAGDARVSRRPAAQGKTVATSGSTGTGSPVLARLPFARLEAERITELVPPAQRFVAMGFDASPAMATSPRMRRYRIVHFAVHAEADPHDPELSSIALSLVGPSGELRDGFLRLHDIRASLTLRADLVVLSACRTALGKDEPGEGVLGLARTFFHAGAARVVASLYRVDDEAAFELMGLFYEAMLGRDRLSPAAALRQAQVRMSSQARWRDPHWWSAFVLMGEPR